MATFSPNVLTLDAVCALHCIPGLCHTADLDDPLSADHEVAKMVSGKVERKVVKQTVMTTVYGVTFIGARDQVSSVYMLVHAPRAKCVRTRGRSSPKSGACAEFGWRWVWIENIYKHEHMGAD
jgi:hypothetical protein